MKKYRKKPIEIEAVQFTGKNFDELHEFCPCIKYNLKDTDTPVIPTLEGNMTVGVGDYIIKGVRGEFYPCKPDIFLQTYEEI